MKFAVIPAVVETILEGRATIQKDLDRLEEWHLDRQEERANRNPTEFNSNKCKVLYLGGRPHPIPTPPPHNDKGWGSSPAEPSLGVFADSKLSMSQPCNLAVMKANGILGCSKTIVSRLKEDTILPPLHLYTTL